MLAFSEEVGNLVSPIVRMHPEAPEVHRLPWLPKNWHLFYGLRTFQLQARVSVQGVESLADHLATLCQEFESKVKKDIIFQKEMGSTFTI